MSAFDGAGPDPQDSFSLSPAKFPGCPSAVRSPGSQCLLAPRAAGNGPDNCSSRVGDFSVWIRMDPTHTSLKAQAVLSSDSLCTYSSTALFSAPRGSGHREIPEQQTQVTHSAVFVVAAAIAILTP